jgi:hypothetical protein
MEPAWKRLRLNGDAGSGPVATVTISLAKSASSAIGRPHRHPLVRLHALRSPVVRKPRQWHAIFAELRQQFADADRLSQPVANILTRDFAPAIGDGDLRLARNAGLLWHAATPFGTR